MHKVPGSNPTQGTKISLLLEKLCISLTFSKNYFLPQKPTASQTHFSFTNMGSEMNTDRATAIWNRKFWFGSPCSSYHGLPPPFAPFFALAAAAALLLVRCRFLEVLFGTTSKVAARLGVCLPTHTPPRLTLEIGKHLQTLKKWIRWFFEDFDYLKPILWIGSLWSNTLIHTCSVEERKATFR